MGTASLLHPPPLTPPPPARIRARVRARCFLAYSLHADHTVLKENGHTFCSTSCYHCRHASYLAHATRNSNWWRGLGRSQLALHGA
eukprot:9480835-Pyramimonas_sp.AAC.2